MIFLEVQSTVAPRGRSRARGNWWLARRFLRSTPDRIAQEKSMRHAKSHEKRITGRVMHEFKHREFRSPSHGEGRRLKYESGARNRRNLWRPKRRKPRNEPDRRRARVNPASAPIVSAK